MSLFITFEGGEGTGKSTQAKALYQRLKRLAFPVLLTHEPGATQVGNRIARILKWAQGVHITPVAELMLFNASRAQLVSEVIKPAMESGKIIVCDRFADSTTAYQGYGRGLDLQMVRAINEAGTSGLKPDLTILLDQPAEAGLARKKYKNPDRFEQEESVFHQRVREGYLKLAAAEPERWFVVNSQQTKAKIAQIIWQRVSQLLSRK